MSDIIIAELKAQVEAMGKELDILRNKNAIIERTNSDDGMFMISPQEAADLACQNAFRRSRGKGQKMKEILEQELTDSIFAKGFRHGGAFAHDANACHPNVPGVNFFQSMFTENYLKALTRHINLIRV